MSRQSGTTSAEQRRDLVRELDVAAGVRVQRGAQPGERPGDRARRRRSEPAAPAARAAQPRRARRAAGGRGALRRDQVDHHEVAAAHRRDHGGRVPRRARDGAGRARGVVQRLEDEAGDARPARAPRAPREPQRVLGR